MLKNNLYTIQHVEQADNRIIYAISLHAECFIYKAHFPDMPITPGVCIIQIVNELLEETVGRTLNIVNVKNAKFLSVMQPEGQTVFVSLSNIKQEETISAQALISGNNNVNYAKISLQTVVA